MITKYQNLVPPKQKCDRLFVFVSILLFLTVILLVVYVVIPILTDSDNQQHIKNELERKYGVAFHFQYKQTDENVYYFSPDGQENLLVAGVTGVNPKAEVVPFPQRYVLDDFEDVIKNSEIEKHQLSDIDLNDKNICSLTDKIYALQSDIEEEFHHYNIEIEFKENTSDPNSIYKGIYPYNFDIVLKVFYGGNAKEVNFNTHDKTAIRDKLLDSIFSANDSDDCKQIFDLCKEDFITVQKYFENFDYSHIFEIDLTNADTLTAYDYDAPTKQALSNLKEIGVESISVFTFYAYNELKFDIRLRYNHSYHIQCESKDSTSENLYENHRSMSDHDNDIKPLSEKNWYYF